MRLTKKQKIEILERQGMKCLGCGRTITLQAHRLRDWKKILGYYPDPSVPSRARFHHVKMRSKGGSDDPSNFIATCGRSHAKRHGYYRKYKAKKDKGYLSARGKEV